MAPRADEFEQENLSATDDDSDDEGFKEDMAALAEVLRKHCPAAPTDASRDLVLRTDSDDVRDPLLDSGDAIVSVGAGESIDSDDSDEEDLRCLQRVESLYKPLSTLPPLPPTTVTTDDDDDEDDIETLRAILNRFSDYDINKSGSLATLTEGDQASSLGSERDMANGSTSHGSEGGELCPVSQDPNNSTNLMTGNIEIQHSGPGENSKPGARTLSKLPQRRSSFPPSAQALFDAIKKNRSLQRFLRSKLIEMEAKIEENKRLRNKVKLLKDFQVSCTRRTGSALSLRKDPRVQLISARKSHNKKKSPMYYGPPENSHVANYKMVLERFPHSLDRKKWSNVERKNLMKGIKQQFQEMVFQISVDRISSESSFGDANDMDSIMESINHLEITPERIREFSPKVNWDQLASIYVPGHTGAECESRWLNCEDPLINRGPWTSEEDRSLLLIVQDMGVRNWFNIAVSLATSRTPFQCLARFQRSLNPSMLNSEWTEEEDAQLCSAVAFFGESNWQAVASVLERRTGTQCSNRWKKSLCPERKGSFTPEEDERLTVAVMLFGRKWNQIAKFVPGRIQSQCRDRYLNSLDPSLKWGGWTEEEDSRLEAAIAKHGFCWSKVAEDVPPRTDSQCRKRWKVLFPDQVHLLQEARKKRKALLAGNFVDRESERPALTLNDFLPLRTLGPPSDGGDVNLPRKRKRKSSNAPKKISSKRPAKKARNHSKDVKDVVYSDEAKTCGENVPLIACSNVPKRMRSKRHARNTPVHSKEVEVTVHSDEVKTCSGDDHTEPNLENQSSTSPCKNPESWTTNGDYREGNCENRRSNRDRTWKQHCGWKLYAKSSLEHRESQGKSFVDGEVLGRSSSRTVSKKESNSRKLSRNIRGTEPSENKLKTKISKPGSLSTAVESLESQDCDNITLASFVHKKPNKRGLKCSKSASRASFSSRTTVVSKQVDNQNPSGEKDGSSQSCGAGGTEDLVMEQNAASHELVRKPESGNKLTGDDDDSDDMTLACLMGNKSKKWSQAAEGHRACSSKSKRGSVLLPEVHCANKAIVIADGNGLSMSKLLEERSISHGGVAEPSIFNVEEENELLASFLRNKAKREQRKAKSHGGNC